jgi:AraC-like DNA-binding protein
MSGAAEMRQLFDHLDGVCFFMKDTEGRFIAIGEGPRQDLNHDEKAVIGCRDFDLYPRHIAERIRADDRRVMESDRPLLNIVEMLVNPMHHAIGWHVTHKFPVHDRAGRVIGLMGTVQPFAGRRKALLSGTRLDDAISHMEERCAQALPIGELAHIAGLSARQFRRKFQEVLGMSPQDFILHTRLARACTALTTTPASVVQIAEQCGFCDQSALATLFRRILGVTPLEYRQRYASALALRHQP